MRGFGLREIPHEQLHELPYTGWTALQKWRLLGGNFEQGLHRIGEDGLDFGGDAGGGEAGLVAAQYMQP